jgi:hypothetical protein
MTILDNSTKNLGKLKEQIEPLVDFFKSVLGDIDHNVDENLEVFLRPIQNGIKNGSSPEEIEAINISHRSKEVSYDIETNNLGAGSKMKLTQHL